MMNRHFVCSRVLAVFLPVTLGLGCGLKRDWSICAPADKQPCLPGYVCTPDLRCVLAGDGGSDALVSIDSQGATDAAGGGDVASPADVPVFAPDAFERASDTGQAPPQTGGAGGASGSGGTVATGGSSTGGASGSGGTAASGGSGTGGVSGSGGTAASGGTGTGGVTGGTGGAPSSDASAATGGSGAGGATGGAPDASAVDAPPIGPVVDAAGTCGTDKECSPQSPLCLANRCAKCGSDSDCAGRLGTPACATSGLCVACTANKHCTGATGTCDTATNQCVGCVKRNDCAGACQACTNGVCTAVKSQDDLGGCAGTCDATGACKSKQGQTCQTTAGGCVTGTSCSPDGYCCDKTCTGSCEACDVAIALGTCTTLAANVAPHTGHTACTGTGTCGGKCDGTSTACAYSTSACGTATCTSSTYQAPGVCSAGVCNLPAAKSCQYGCASASGGCACPPGLTGPNCDLTRFVVITPKTVTTNSWANDTNSDGTVVTGSQGGTAFIWTQAAGSTPLTVSATIASSVGNAINSDGTVIVGQVVSTVSGTTQQAFRWTQATGMVALASSGTGSEVANSVTADGSTIVGSTDRFGAGVAPFRWTSATGIVLMASVTGATASAAYRISRDGSTVIGSGSDPSGYVGVRWSGSAAGQVLSFPLGFVGTNPLAVTSNGSAVFGIYAALAGPDTPFEWTPPTGSVILAQSVLGVWGLFDVTGDGSILVGSGDATQGGFIWELPNGQPRLLSDILSAEGVTLNGLTQLTPLAISDDGNVIVGSALVAATNTIPEYNVAFLARWR